MTEPENNKFTFKNIFALHGDPILWTIFFILCVISILEVYSAGASMGYGQRSLSSNIIKHIALVVSGFGVVLLTHHIPCKYFRLGYFLYPATVGLLILTLAIGTSENNGTRWLWGLQPSEFAKGALVLITAHFLTNGQTEKGTDRHAFWPIVTRCIITCALIMTENVSTALMLGFVIFLMMIIGRMPTRQIVKLGLSILLFGATLTATLLIIPKEKVETISKEYAPLHRAANFRGRLARHFHLEADTTNTKALADSTKEKTFDIDKNMQEGHAYIAIVKSNGIGRGPGNSTERDFIPQAYSDFIYAIIIEETGIIGALVVLMLYIFILFRAGKIANRCEKNFPAFLTLGLALLIVIQAMINMGVAVGLFPVTGQPLPMISKGGTSMLVTSLYFGIMISVSRFADKRKTENKTTSTPQEPMLVN